MNEVTRVVDAIRNSSDATSGTTVRSSPTMPPTKALTRTSSENCRQFSARPSRTPELDRTSRLRGGKLGVQRPKLRGVDRRPGNIGQHGPDKSFLGFAPGGFLWRGLAGRGG